MAATFFCALGVSGAALCIPRRISCAFISLTLGISSAAFIIAFLALRISGPAACSAFLGTDNFFCIFGSITVCAPLGAFFCAAGVFSGFPCIFFFLAGVLFSAEKFSGALLGFAGSLLGKIAFAAGLFAGGLILSLRFALS